MVTTMNTAIELCGFEGWPVVPSGYIKNDNVSLYNVCSKVIFRQPYRLPKYDLKQVTLVFGRRIVSSKPCLHNSISKQKHISNQHLMISKKTPLFEVLLISRYQQPEFWWLKLQRALLQFNNLGQCCIHTIKSAYCIHIFSKADHFRPWCCWWFASISSKGAMFSLHL